MKVLVAGVGNLLRGDDGFGVVVAERLMREQVPDGVRVVEIGIGGIHLVQDLLEGFDALVVIDALELGRPAGTVVVMRPDVLDVKSLPLAERHDQLADVHYATPERALMLAEALGCLPGSTWLVGCQAQNAEGYGEGLSPALEGAVETAAQEVRGLVSALGVGWSAPFSSRPAGYAGIDVEEERKTEQDDELSEEHSLASKAGHSEHPYRPARQPAQEQPDEESEEGKETGF